MAEYGPWVKVEHCSKCDQELTDDEVNYSEGVCPYCGGTNPFSGSLIARYPKVRRKRYIVNARRKAIEAQKLKNAGWFSFEALKHFFKRYKKKSPAFQWEYKLEEKEA